MTQPGDAWYYATPQGDRMGPVSYQVMCDLVRGGRITQQSLVWAAHLPEWTPAERVQDLAAYSFPIPDAARVAVTWTNGQDVIDTIKNLEFASAVVWSLIAGVQILIAIFGSGWEFFLLLAGIWNIFAAVSRFGRVKKIQERRRSVPASYQGVAQLIFIAIANVLFGACLGALWVIVDFIIRDKVLKNRQLFNL